MDLCSSVNIDVLHKHQISGGLHLSYRSTIHDLFKGHEWNSQALAFLAKVRKRSLPSAWDVVNYKHVRFHDDGAKLHLLTESLRVRAFEGRLCCRKKVEGWWNGCGRKPVTFRWVTPPTRSHRWIRTNMRISTVFFSLLKTFSPHWGVEVVFGSHRWWTLLPLGRCICSPSVHSGRAPIGH